jgi:hypothetical protein
VTLCVNNQTENNFQKAACVGIKIDRYVMHQVLAVSDRDTATPCHANQVTRSA